MSLEKFRNIRRGTFIGATIEDIVPGDIIRVFHKYSGRVWIIIYNGISKGYILAKDCKYYSYTDDKDDYEVDLDTPELCDISTVHYIQKYDKGEKSFGW